MNIDNDPRITYHHDGDYWTWNINGTTGDSDMIEDVQAALNNPRPPATTGDTKHTAVDREGL